MEYLIALKDRGYEKGLDLDTINKAEHNLISSSLDIGSELDIAKAIRELVNSPLLVPKDLKIDDGDLPAAPNFYQWCSKPQYGQIGEELPFLEQMMWGIITFSEFCPVCSDLEWVFHDHKVDDTFAKLERKVALLEHGVCPHCKQGKAQLAKKGLLKFYNELAVNAGQRCVVGSTNVFTVQGMLHMDEIVHEPPPGFTPLSINVYNGTEFEVTSQFFHALPEQLLKITLESGHTITGTSEHPIHNGTDFVRLSELSAGQTIPVHYGTRCFGPLSNTGAKELGRTFRNTSVGINIRRLDGPSTTLFLQGVFEYASRVFLSTSVIHDISCMLTNAGYEHTIHGPSIALTSDAHKRLKSGQYITDAVSYKIVDISVHDAEDTYDFTLPSTHQFITNGLLSHNSGKSHTVGTYLTPYQTHKLLKTQKPSLFYGLSATTVLHGTFVALTYTQAKDTLWTPYYGALVNSQWFNQYHSMLRHYEAKYGEKLFKFTDTFVDYRVRGLQIYPAGPDRRVLRGRTRIFGSVDELAHFDQERDTQKVKVNAREIYTALKNSCLTVRGGAYNLLRRKFNDVLSAYMYVVSSPTARNDILHELVAEARNPVSLTYGIHRPTWDINPNFPRNHPDIVAEYAKDPLTAERDYGANPPAVANPFITQHRVIYGALQNDVKNPIHVKTVFRNSKEITQSYVYAEIEKLRKSGTPSLLAVDAGEVDNSFAITVGTTDGYNLSIDLVCEIMAQKGFHINFTLVYQNVILPIMQKRNVKVILADRWNSAKLLTDAVMDMGGAEDEDGNPLFYAERHSLRYEEMEAVRTCFEQEIVSLPRCELPARDLLEALDNDYRAFYAGKPVAHLVKQMLTIKDGQKHVLKGDGYTDDLWRSAALCVWGLQNEKFLDLLLKEPDPVYESQKPAIGVSRLGSGGGASVGNGAGGPTLLNGCPIAVGRR